MISTKKGCFFMFVNTSNLKLVLFYNNNNARSYGGLDLTLQTVYTKRMNV